MSNKSKDKSIAPCMGQIVGWLEDGTQTDNIYEGKTECSNLQKVGGFLGIGTTDQKRYCSNGAVGRTGKA